MGAGSEVRARIKASAEGPRKRKDGRAAVPDTEGARLDDDSSQGPPDSSAVERTGVQQEHRVGVVGIGDGCGPWDALPPPHEVTGNNPSTKNWSDVR